MLTSIQTIYVEEVKDGAMVHAFLKRISLIMKLVKFVTFTPRCTQQKQSYLTRSLVGSVYILLEMTTFICDCNLFSIANYLSVCASECVCVFWFQTMITATTTASRLRQIFHFFNISHPISIADLVRSINDNEDDGRGDGGGCGGDDVLFVRLQHHCELS